MVKRKLNKDRVTKKCKNVRSFRSNNSSESSSVLNQYSICKDYASEACVGPLDVPCVWCNAKLFHNESIKFCCGGGAIQIEHLPEFPVYISELLNTSTHFLQNLRKYNNAFAMTSLGCREIWDCLTFRISGKLYHRIGSLVPLPQDTPQFLQIYFLGNSNEETETRKANTDHQLHIDILKQLQDIMHTNNAYVQLLTCAYEKAEQLDGNVKVVIRDSMIPRIHKGCTNSPTTDEVAVFISGNTCCQRDIIIECEFICLYNCS